MGAIYASMSGSGSAMFGLFSDDVSIPDCLKNHFIYSGVLG
jgi:shikimate kinase